MIFKRLLVAAVMVVKLLLVGSSFKEDNDFINYSVYLPPFLPTIVH